MLSMPESMKLDLPMLPLATSYLRAEPAQVQRWRSRLGAICAADARDLPGKRVGIVWGIGVSPGIAEGTVRVVRDADSDQADDFEPGDILVCRITDPSWAPLLSVAAAVVIDIGGSLSHGAIVARELGIPCVINTVDGSRRLRTGDRVTVDGSAGSVQVRSQ